MAVFLLLLLSCNFDNQLSPNYHRFVIYVYVGIHQVRIMVFDNYQRVKTSLISSPNLGLKP